MTNTRDDEAGPINDETHEATKMHLSATRTMQPTLSRAFDLTQCIGILTTETAITYIIRPKSEAYNANHVLSTGRFL